MNLRTPTSPILASLLLCFVAAVSLAQQPPRPAGRPQGSLVRPTDAVKHPALDKAWAEHDAAVARAGEAIKAAISEQFDAVTAEGDLEAAEKWEAVKNQFESTGQLPDDSRTDAAVVAAVAEYWEAQGELAKAYAVAIKELTVQKKIAEAKAVREELRKQQINNCDPIKQRKIQKELDAIADRGGWFWVKGKSSESGPRFSGDTNNTPIYLLNKEKREFTHLARKDGAVIRKWSPTYEIVGVEGDDENIVVLKMVYPSEGLKPGDEATFHFNRKTGNIDSPFGYFAQPMKAR
jgi:hypothetical protein